MAFDLEQERHQLHELIDHLPVRQVVAVRGLVEAMLDPFELALAKAEVDTEPTSEAERREIEAEREWFEHNQGISLEEVLADCGLTMEEVRSHSDRDIKDGKNLASSVFLP